RFFERKATIHACDDLSLPEMMFVVAATLVVFDHRFRTSRVITLGDMRVQCVDDAYHVACRQDAVVLDRVAVPARLPRIEVPAASADTTAPTAHKSNTSDVEKMILRTKEYISEGNIFQVVLSQRFESEFSGGPLDLYHCIRFGNPSPYKFL